MSAFVRLSRDQNSWVQFTMPSNGRVTAQYECRIPGTSPQNLIILFSTTLNVNWYRGVAVRNNTSTNIRVSQLFIDGINIGSINAITQAQVFNIIPKNRWFTVRYENWSASNTDANPNQFVTNAVLEFLNYRPFTGSDGDVKNFKIDVGLTGSWTHESYLGDTNGFSRQNAPVLYDDQFNKPSKRTRFASQAFNAGRYRTQQLIGSGVY